ncbi:MAG: hypothetical protein RLO52_26025 [Sandaracinaceae bacterium]
MSRELDEETARFRPSVRPFLIAAAVNVLLGAVLLGIPYSRGPDRAGEVPGRFAAFTACLFDGEALEDPGLGLPSGERARYASLVVDAGPDWPARCLPLLDAIPPEESRFLFPNVKNAEAGLRATAQLTRRELEALARARGEGEVSVPDRPMRAFQRLRGALAELGLVTGEAGLRADRDAIRFAPAPLPTPSLIPLRVSLQGEWAVVLRDGALIAGAIDDTRVSHVRVAGGGVDLRYTRRETSVRGMQLDATPPWVFWTTAEAQCDEDGCVHRSTGAGAFLEGRQELAPTVWLQGHPAIVPSAIHVTGSTAWVAARAEAGHELRRFTLPEPTLPGEGEPPQRAAEVRLPLSLPERATLAWTDEALVWAGSEQGGRLSFSGEEATFPVPPGALQLAVCGGWIAAGGARGIVARSPTGALHALDGAVRPPTPRAIRIACDTDAAEIWWLEDGALRRARCDDAGCADAPAPEGAARGFDAVRFRGVTLVAWSAQPEGATVRLARVDGEAIAVSVPAACWTDPTEGLCGAPRLATDGSTVMLIGRHEDELRVLTSDDGARWTALPGLGQP